MARKRTHTPRDILPREADDFTSINGIGPIIKTRLHNAGIRTFAQFAALSAEAIVSLVPNLSAKQVTKQGWIEQARKLASSKVSIKTRETESAIAVGRQHYENFTLEFLLGEKNKVRRIQMVHIQSGDVDTWTKWDVQRLVDFLAHHTGRRLLATKSVVLAAVKPKPTFKPLMATDGRSEISSGAGSIQSADKPQEKIDSGPSVEITESISPIFAPSDRPSSIVVPAKTINRIRLLEWKTLLSGTQQILQSLLHDQCFDVALTLDISDVSLPETSQLDFTVSLYAKKLGNGTRKVIGQTHRTLPYASTANLTIGNAILSQGLYRLDALVTLVPVDASLSTRSAINASFSGGLLQVY